MVTWDTQHAYIPSLVLCHQILLFFSHLQDPHFSRTGSVPPVPQIQELALLAPLLQSLVGEPDKGECA